jgi:hypothetical protein
LRGQRKDSVLKNGVERFMLSFVGGTQALAQQVAFFFFFFFFFFFLILVSFFLFTIMPFFA